MGVNGCRFSTGFVAKIGYRFQGKNEIGLGMGKAKAV
jgi:hypothetical protein